MAIMTFNDIDLSDYITITSIHRDIGNERMLNMDNATKLGSVYKEVRISHKVISLDFYLKDKTNEYAMNQLKHTLAGIFNVDEPVKIIFSDEPDKYYLGLPSGKISASDPIFWLSLVTLELLIPDGVAHSSTYKKFDSAVDATVTDEKMTFSLTNNGSAPAFPIVTIKHNAENGYLGLVNSEKAFELGNPEEADAETFKRSESLLDYRGNNKIATAVSQAGKNVAVLNDSNPKLNSTLGTVSIWGRVHAYLKSRGGTTGNNGGSLTWDIPNDSAGGVGSLNDYIWWRQIFCPTHSNQYGFMKLSVSDTEGKFLYGVDTFKSSNGLNCRYSFLASNGKGGYNVLKTWNFTGTNLDKNNPFNQSKGFSDLKRNDDKVQVYWWGSYPVFKIPEIKGRKSAKVHFTFGAMGNKPLVSRMYLDELFYRKDHVSITRDIPNRFPIGSELVINSEEDTVYVDGIPKIDEVVDGSQWLSIPAGKSELECYVSSFVETKPTISIEFEERWL